MKIYKTFLTVGLLLVGASANAASWLECDGDSGKKQKWSVDEIRVEISTTSYPENWRTRIKDAIKIVNTNPSPFWINTVERGGGVGDGNGQNEVYSAHIGALGVARYWNTCEWFFGWEWGKDEVDVILDASPTYKNGKPFPPWTLSKLKSQNYIYYGPKAMAESVFVHEFGHLLGLMHVNSEYNVMGDAGNHLITQNGKTRSYFGEDASWGARQLYGTQSSAFRDLSVSHFRYTGVSGEYSTHDRTRAFRNNGTSWVQTGVYGGTSDGSVIEPFWEVNLGERIRFEYTVENNGKQTENNVRGGVYISTNDWISKQDRLMGTHVWNSIAAQGAAYTFTVEITVPNNLQRRRVYWVGYIIDDNNTVHEKTGRNNAAYVPVWIN